MPGTQVGTNFLGLSNSLVRSDIFQTIECSVQTLSQLRTVSEIQLAAEQRVISAKKKAQYSELLELSFPRNSIVKIILQKSDKPTVNGSRKLLPDVHSFYQVLRSGPTSVQVKNIADGTVKTIRKSSISLVTFNENQHADQLMRDNFPKSLLWAHNQYHRKQTCLNMFFIQDIHLGLKK